MLILVAVLCFIFAVISWTYSLERFRENPNSSSSIVPCLSAIVFIAIAADRLYTAGQESGAIQHYLNNIKVVRDKDYWANGRAHVSYNVYWIDNNQELPHVKDENK